MRLTPHSALIGSGDLGGFSMSRPLDCHIYLVAGGDELALVDAGSGRDIDLILRQIQLAGYAIQRIRYLLVTHGHYDHAGGSRALRERLGLQVVASQATAQLLESADSEGIGLGPAQRAGLYPANLRLDPCPVDIVVGDGDPVEVGSLSLQVLATPGHSADHVAYLLAGPEQALFSGDTVFAEGTIILQNLPDCNLRDCAATIQRLSTLEVNALLPGHGLFALTRGGRHLAAAAAALDQLRIPDRLVI